MSKARITAILAFWLILCAAPVFSASYQVVETGQDVCFDADSAIDCPGPGEPFYGQDAQYMGNEARYRDNGDGTVSDLVTGLTWVQARGEKVTWDAAMRGAAACRVGGHHDWRMPSIKELYSLIDFRGWARGSASESIPFIDTRYFAFEYGDASAGERYIDCQDWSATEYRGTTMGGNPTVFGVNFADGRIKGYPKNNPRRGDKKLYARYVRGNRSYGRNDFAVRGDVVEDRATGLVWQREDSGRTLNWQGALGYCEDLVLGGRSDWRLPGAKELQSIVDYGRGPASTGSAAIDPVFRVSEIESYYWTSTTHLDGRADRAGSAAAYLAFGRAMGYMRAPGSSGKRLMDVHGAGAQRSDPKAGDPADYPRGFGPQGDDRRIYNYVRCVSGGAVAYEPPASARRELEGLGAGQGGGRRDPSSGPQGRGMRLGPPQEAVDACRGKSAEDSCSFRAPHGKVVGICAETGGGMSCVPARSSRERRPRPGW